MAIVFINVLLIESPRTAGFLVVKSGVGATETRQ